MPVPLSTVGSPPHPLPHTRPTKRSTKHRRNGHNIDINTQLLEAITQGKTSVVRRLISSGADPNTCSTVSTTRDPALMIACNLSSYDTSHIILGLLLSKGASVDASNSVGQTVLMQVAMCGDVEACTMLLDAGATVDKVDCDGNTALCYAAQNGHDGVTRKLIETITQQRLDLIDHRNIKGLTALLLACQRGHLSTARILVKEGGASPSIRDVDNFATAAEWIQKSGHYSENDLKFLYPVSRKKSYYRQQRQEKGIKTLSDYLSLEQGQPSGNVFTINESTTREDLSGLARLPHLSSHSATSQPPTLSPSRSMFDIPPITTNNTTIIPIQQSSSSRSSPFRKKSIILPRIKQSNNKQPNVSFTHDYKSDLYHSQYLKQRQRYVTPNRQSDGFHAGSLQPLPSEQLERIGRNNHLSVTAERSNGYNPHHHLHHQNDGSDDNETSLNDSMNKSIGRGNRLKGKHKILPPLE